MAELEAVIKFFFLLFPLMLLHVCCTQRAVSRSVVKFLPGFQRPLPFELETGYVGVDESEDVQLFYYFVKSQGNAKEDPILLWLVGGPGCSALSGLVYEIGPINFEVVEYNGSLPTLVLNPHSWTQVANIIFVDMPAGTGFSYARTTLASVTGDSRQVSQTDQFLRKWLMDHPEFLSNPVYIGGDSYSGITLPAVVQQLSDGNDKDMEPLINLKGYLLGNPVTDRKAENNWDFPFAHGMGLISDELYESLKKSCGREFTIIDPANVECLEHKQSFQELTSNIDFAHVLEPNCVFLSPRPREIFGERRTLDGSSPELEIEPSLPTIGCRSYGYLLSKYWANDHKVQEALNVRKRTKENWQRCNYGLPYSHDIATSIQYHAYLGTKDYRSLIYSGDHDMIVPFLATQAWIRSLNYSIIDDWRAWNLEGQVAGYTRTYSNHMTFATVKASSSSHIFCFTKDSSNSAHGAGHTAPEYRPAECFAMFKRWISHELL
ncbi:hypothetical protein Tsubulata_042804 [Turnera subulata]|uniref:Uncharacterized protein n=1 Tax=Turnera subulata TaxID=218843 RepID=A0A9Q0J2F8_9ROSI|nr:hypothetical protein Tsubulata_042804 [Turnera subulata]